VFFTGRGKRVSDRRVIARLQKLAVPPAYQDVLYASDPRAHLQAVGRDAAGRLQYRYHPDWEKVRDIRKAQRLANLIDVLPRIRRVLASALKEDSGRTLALAAIIELVDASAIRTGNEAYAREHKTRGATTLLKSNVECHGDTVILCFRAKGGKRIQKEFRNARLCKALSRLRKIPGRRLFQYRMEDETVHVVTSQEVNGYLREIAGCKISLKDFRTLCGSLEALQILAATEPAQTVRGRKAQIKRALETAAQFLENTPTVCRKSYVHPAILTAFESGSLRQFAATIGKSSAAQEKAVAEIIAGAAV
jgi:DNA topoisomerase-1